LRYRRNPNPRMQEVCGAVDGDCSAESRVGEAVTGDDAEEWRSEPRQVAMDA